MKTSQVNNQSILIIGTEPDDFQILVNILGQGYDFFYCENLRRVRRKMECSNPNLILIELNQSDFNNYLICQQIKNIYSTHNIPIIFLITIDDICQRGEIYAMGGADYILQPYQEDEVRSKVKNQSMTQFIKNEVKFSEPTWEFKIQQRTSKLQEYTAQLEQQIQEFKKTEKRLAYNAFHDHLTGLPNRTLLMTKIEDAFQLAKDRPNYSFALLFIDIDRFKSINDNCGHAVGDRLLIAIAKLLSQDLRSIDTASRLGGDEFVILLEDIQKKADVIQICDRLFARLKTPLQIDSWTISINLSIGIAFSSSTYPEAAQILHDADTAMYRAKEQTQSSYQIFQSNLAKRAKIKALP